VGIIPFRIMDATVAANPLKVYEYAAMEVPIVCTNLPECRLHESVQLAQAPSEFLQCLELAVARHGDSELRRSLRDLALRNTWDQRVKTVLEVLQRGSRSGKAT
jgi:hypothetical protein